MLDGLGQSGRARCRFPHLAIGGLDPVQEGGALALPCSLQVELAGITAPSTLNNGGRRCQPLSCCSPGRSASAPDRRAWFLQPSGAAGFGSVILLRKLILLRCRP